MPTIDLPASDQLAADAAARRRALDLASFIVEAPAGAGKTELLTQRFLRLLVTVESPEEVVAITFTNKAAAEMRARILRNLHAAAAGERPSEAHRQVTYELAQSVLDAARRQGWALLEQPGRLRILTIDALCAALARQMPLLTRFGAQPVATMEPQPLYEEAVRETLALLEDDDEARAGPIAAALTYLDNDFARLDKLLVGMLERRDQWLKPLLPHFSFAEASDCALAELIGGEIAAVARRFGPAVQQRLMPIARFAADTLVSSRADSPITALLDWQDPLPADAFALRTWQGVVELLLTKDGSWRKSLTIAIGLPAGKEGKPWKEALTALIEELAAEPGFAARLAKLRELPALDDRADEDAIVQVFGEVLKLAAANLFDVFRRRGACDFVEVAQRAVQALGDEDAPSDLALRLDYKISHLLVDEFQDTSPAQIELLRRLTAGWSGGDGRTLFCVGDPMQSIYRFRKADVGLFLTVARDGIGGLPLTPLRLFRNNRSCAPVVDWINGAFGRIFPGADDAPRGAIAYREFAATRADLPAAGVATHPLLLPAAASGEACGEREAEHVLSLIETTWQDDPAREVAVLVRSRRHLDPLVALIRRQRAQWRFQSVDIESLADRQWIDDLQTLTRALLHRADRLSWLALLRSPLCGLCLADLHALAADRHPMSVWRRLRQACAESLRPAEVASDLGAEAPSAPEAPQPTLPPLTADGAERIARLVGVLSLAFAERGRQRLARWIEAVWLALGGPATLPDAAAAQDADSFFALIETLDASGEFTLDRLPDQVAGLFAAPDPAPNRPLKLMTIHKAKGLEFDTVILPGLARKVAGNDADLLRWEEFVDGAGREALIVAPLSPRRQKNGAPTAYSYLQGLEKERADNEDLRVLYVGATRAVRALHLVAALPIGDDGNVRASANTPLGTLWPVVEPMFAVAEPQAVASASALATTWEAYVPPLLRQPLDAYAPLGRSERGESRAGKARPATQVSVRTPADAADAAVGTLVHRYLELVARGGLADWPGQRFTTLRPAMQGFLRQQGLSSQAADQGAQRAAAMLARIVASEAGRWLLAAHPQGLAEHAMAAGAAGEIAVVDRSFVADGERWIVDYKTGVVAAGAGPAELAQLAATHRPQLARYAALFADEALPQRWAIFFTDLATPTLVELPPG